MTCLIEFVMSVTGREKLSATALDSVAKIMPMTTALHAVALGFMFALNATEKRR